MRGDDDQRQPSPAGTDGSRSPELRRCGIFPQEMLKGTRPCSWRWTKAGPGSRHGDEHWVRETNGELKLFHFGASPAQSEKNFTVPSWINTIISTLLEELPSAPRLRGAEAAVLPSWECTGPTPKSLPVPSPVLGGSEGIKSYLRANKKYSW